MTLQSRLSSRVVLFTGLLMLLCAIPMAACSHKPVPRAPLMLGARAPAAALGHTEHGIREYQSGRFLEARTAFESALTAAPNYGEAHYNLGLTLFALGETEQARDHFIEAANLAPGNKVIWDSPALRPYGAPEPAITKSKEQSYSTQRPTMGGMGPR
jgi:tetratricopeptide (TPR) repeat protein